MVIHARENAVIPDYPHLPKKRRDVAQFDVVVAIVRTQDENLDFLDLDDRLFCLCPSAARFCPDT